MLLGQPGLRRDIVTGTRPTWSIDSEGNRVGTYAALPEAWGTFGMPSGKDIEIAAARNAQVDAVLATTTQYAVNDHLTVRGQLYTVVNVDDVRLHLRVHLRRVGTT